MPRTLILLAAIAAIAAITPPAAAEPPLAVEIVTAHTEGQTVSHSLTGEIRAHDSLSAAFTAGGRLVEVTVEAGAEVDRGAVLARMDSVQQEQALRAAEAGLQTAAADHRQAAENLDRQDALLERGATTRIARDGAEDALRIAEGALAEAEATLDRARKALDDTVLTAPEGATVTRRLAEPGQIVGAAQPVMELALGAGIDAIFDVPEVLLTGAGDFPTITLNLIERPEIAFTGRIEEISPVVDATTGTVTVKVHVSDPPKGLTFGEAVRGSAAQSEPARVILPYAAISATAAGPAVWQVDPATMAVSTVPVAIDRYETGRFVVAAGIADGALIVARGAQLLYPGRIVRAAGGMP
ncbi:efflux RND transporter periplasmic adaptor subunit [Albidovulum sp.]|uniref:efflux RND transporter periplasmic adaptor subunit n=1 Tax=Albidovulum sp. TaxID=1872424 RepID=UPI0039B8CEE7